MQGSEEENAAGGHLRVCASGSPETLDPALAVQNPEKRVVGPLFDGLTRLGPYGRAKPSLAESWESSEDDRRWTFQLRQDARWSDGTRIVAGDIAFHVARVLHPATGAFHRSMLTRIAGVSEYVEMLEEEGARSIDYDTLSLPESVGVRALDAETLVIEFEKPTPSAPAFVALPTFRPTPRQALEAWGDAWSEPSHIVTSGPFHLEEHSREVVRLSRSERYWDRENIEVEGLTLLAPETLEQNLERFRDGRCDLTAPNALPTSVDDHEHLERHVRLGTYYYVINSDRVESRELRRALAQAVDREAVAEMMGPSRFPTTSFTAALPRDALAEEELTSACADAEEGARVFPTSLQGACYEPPSGLRFDPDAARRSLKRAEKRSPDAIPEPIEIRTNALPPHERVAEAVASQWREHLGLEVETRSMPWAPFLESLGEGDFQVARVGWIPETRDLRAFLARFRCGKDENRASHCDPKFDELLDAALASSDPADRLRLGRQAEARLLEGAPIIPLHVYAQRWLRRPFVEGMVLHLGGASPLSEARIESEGAAAEAP